MIADPSKQTSCKNCIFAIYEGNTQIGCHHNRIEKFEKDVIEAYDIDKEFYVINRICSTFRNNRWNEGQPDILKARKESCLSFDLFIDVNDIDETYYNSIKETLNNIDYPENKYRVIFFHNNSVNKIGKKYVSNLYQFFPDSIISVYFDRSEYLNAIISKSKNSFHIILNKDNITTVNTAIITAEKAINDNLQRFIVAKYSNLILISNLFCRFVCPNLYVEYDKNIKNLISDAIKQNLYAEF